MLWLGLHRTTDANIYTIISASPPSSLVSTRALQGGRLRILDCSVGPSSLRQHSAIPSPLRGLSGPRQATHGAVSSLQHACSVFLCSHRLAFQKQPDRRVTPGWSCEGWQSQLAWGPGRRESIPQGLRQTRSPGCPLFSLIICVQSQGAPVQESRI